jgi:integrase
VRRILQAEGRSPHAHAIQRRASGAVTDRRFGGREMTNDETVVLRRIARNNRDGSGGSLGHLREYFSGTRAKDITTDRIIAYTAFRRAEKAEAATVNRELAALKRALRSAARAGKVAQAPDFSLLREDNARKGFFEPEQFHRVLKHLPNYLKRGFEVAYITGWRVPSEVLTRRWQHVDLDGGWLRLEPGESKNYEGRMFPTTPELTGILTRQLERTRRLEKAIGRIIPWVFHREGTPIKDYYEAWDKACSLAGVPDRLAHDLRRTAVRNLERAGVARSAAMKMTGHKTESIYRRYAIVDEAMLKESASKLAAFEADKKK